MDNKEIKVFLVDDENDFTEPLSFWLKSKGYTVTVFSSGETAISVVKENAPNIIFLDLNMPGMDGVETLKNIREFDKSVPVIMVSAHVENPRMAEASRYGVSGVFYKGKDFSEVISLLEVTLRTHKNL